MANNTARNQRERSKSPQRPSRQQQSNQPMIENSSMPKHGSAPGKSAPFKRSKQVAAQYDRELQ